jgi:hypothetical protein
MDFSARASAWAVEISASDRHHCRCPQGGHSGSWIGKGEWQGAGIPLGANPRCIGRANVNRKMEAQTAAPGIGDRGMNRWQQHRTIMEELLRRERAGLVRQVGGRWHLTPLGRQKALEEMRETMGSGHRWSGSTIGSQDHEIAYLMVRQCYPCATQSRQSLELPINSGLAHPRAIRLAVEAI